MVIDSCALLAIFLAEPESEQFLKSIVNAPAKLVSAASLLETGIVLESRLGDAAGREFDLFVLRAGLEVVPVDAEQIEIARSAWRKYGKGRHRAALNFGDCFSYALSKVSGEPLLAKGDDFARTDVELSGTA
jgi:ribonuclease VapC